MGRILSLFATVFLVLMLVMTNAVEGRTCESKSHRFKGVCVSQSNCGTVCKTEGFHWGKCRGFRRRCFCTRHC